MPVHGISEQGRATQGVKLIRVDDGDEIAAITNLDELEVTGGEIVVEGVTDIEQVVSADKPGDIETLDEGTSTDGEDSSGSGISRLVDEAEEEITADDDDDTTDGTENASDDDKDQPIA
jgi:DNA gyrase subunit A